MYFYHGKYKNVLNLMMFLYFTPILTQLSTNFMPFSIPETTVRTDFIEPGTI